MPRHIEHPGLRHSAPAFVKIGVEPLGFGLRLHLRGARHHEHAETVVDAPAVEHRGGGAQILDPAVGARADEDGVEL